MSMPFVAPPSVADTLIFPWKLLGIVSALNLTTVTPFFSDTVRVGFSYLNSLFGGSDEFVPTSIMASGFGGAWPRSRTWTITVAVWVLRLMYRGRLNCDGSDLNVCFGNGCRCLNVSGCRSGVSGQKETAHHGNNKQRRANESLLHRRFLSSSGRPPGLYCIPLRVRPETRQEMNAFAACEQRIT